ncbi:magnesium transporter CorA family protein [Paenibacillus gallinarum]|uniref:Magnesium transporter CorA family protein n=1 Tax=Paenibacillus gallinarum TaxID=2762232 RepID=A0ABR8T4K6_9BACL|nr:magnesium transporter CorA family protein [Paenibacillus gallinarum]MBD7970698.1 magnesium transporter CorA family protein [Paenibacillus gallinarum]
MEEYDIKEMGHDLKIFDHFQWRNYNVTDLGCKELKELRDILPGATEWLSKLPDLETNYISARTVAGGKQVLFGSILYTIKKDIGEEGIESQFYFYVEPGTLVTLNIDEGTRQMLYSKERLMVLSKADDAVSGLFIMARTLLHYFHIGMDEFELNLRKLEKSMEEKNARTLMDKILNARFELLFWSNQFISFQELMYAANEAFYELDLEKRLTYKKLYYRMKRMDSLFKHYEKEIDTLISIDDASSSIRGNDIMKTLTIVTSVFTPATAVGAIWGMNFENLPWITTSWGFTVTITVTLLSMVSMYLWMYFKGWTGDILKIKTGKVQKKKNQE